MLSQLGRRNPRFFSGRTSRRNPLADVDLILWGVPLAMVAIAVVYLPFFSWHVLFSPNAFARFSWPMSMAFLIFANAYHVRAKTDQAR